MLFGFLLCGVSRLVAFHKNRSTGGGWGGEVGLCLQGPDFCMSYMHLAVKQRPLAAASCCQCNPHEAHALRTSGGSVCCGLSLVAAAALPSNWWMLQEMGSA